MFQVGLCGVLEIRPIDEVARVGGEEFVVVLAPMTKENIMMVAEKLRHAVEELEFSVGEGKQKETFHVTISIGATYSDPAVLQESLRPLRGSEEYGHAYSALLDKEYALIRARADDACYASKHSGRNRVTAYDDVPVASRTPPSDVLRRMRRNTPATPSKGNPVLGK